MKFNWIGHKEPMTVEEWRARLIPPENSCTVSRMDEDLAQALSDVLEKLDQTLDRLDTIQSRLDTSARDQRLADALARKFDKNADDVLRIINEAQGGV